MRTPGGGKAKSNIVVAAERIDRRTALLTGYLHKKNSADKWQKRYFEIVDRFFVYYKNHSSPEMLCAMDLWRASPAELAPIASGDSEQREFSITWDRFRLFRASSQAEAVRWVNAIAQVQSMRPPEPVTGVGANGALLAGPPTPSLAGYAKDRSGGAGAAGGAGGGAGTGEVKEWGGGKSGTGNKTGSLNDDGTEAEGGVCGSCTIS